MAAGGVALIGGAARIGRNHLDGFEGNVEFLGRDLLEGGLKTLAEFDLAGEGRDAAVGVDADPGIQIGSRGKTAWRFRRRYRRGRLILRKSLRQREADDQRAAAGEHLAAVENEGAVHCALLWPLEASAVCIRCAARCTARRMRMWVPQR